MVGYKVKDVTDVHGADEPIDFHEPDWHGGQCQSGRWSGGNKVNYSACKWYQSSVAMNHFIGGKSGGSIYYKPIQCPTGFIRQVHACMALVMALMRNTLMLIVAPSVKSQHQEDSGM